LLSSLGPFYVVPVVPVCSGPALSHPHQPHEQLLVAVVGVLCQHCCHWWCCPSHSRHCHRPHHAVLALLLALAVAFLAHCCPLLMSLSLIAISTHNPPYGQVQPHSFLSLSPPHCHCSPSFPVPIPVVSCFHPMSSHGGSGCGGVAVVSGESAPHILVITTKENIGYLTEKKKKISSTMQTTAAIIHTHLWVGVSCTVSTTVASDSSYPKAQRKALSKKSKKQNYKAYQQHK
jgi:hypothetical protein